MNKELNRIVTFLMALAVTALLVGMTWSALAQKPTQDQPQSANANQNKNAAPQVPSTTKTPVKPETTTPEATPPTTPDVAPTAPTQTPEAQTTQPTTTPTTSRKTKKPRKATAETVETAPAATTTPTQSEQVDLSGTYSGVWNCPDAGMTGDSTITVTGNQFTLADGKSGRILATSTRGYTAVAMQFGETPTTTPATGQTQTQTVAPKIMSFRGRRSGSRLTLSPVPGGAQCSFSPTTSVARSRRGRNMKKTTLPAAAGESTGNAATTPPVVEPTAGPAPEPTTPRKSRSRSNRTSNRNANVNANMTPEMNTNQNTGAGNANANTNAKPAPSPTPTPRNR